jgi:spermidine synthase
MCAHPQPLRVFIGGGGEGATLREVLKHSSVTRATMCDIDEEVVSQCKQHLPSWSKGSFDDPRAELVFTDAKAYVEANGPWDIIILDLADPLECGPAFALYTQEFYRTCMDKLTPHGLLVTQAGPSDYTASRDVYTPVYAPFFQSEIPLCNLKMLQVCDAAQRVPPCLPVRDLHSRIRARVGLCHGIIPPKHCLNSPAYCISRAASLS